MKITVFTSNQIRHNSLISRLSQSFNCVYAIQECNTVFPGRVQDFFKRSPVMQQYFTQVISAEHKVFGSLSFLPSNVASFAVKSGDLGLIERDVLAPALDSDVFLVFGSSYIKGWLADELISKRAINIHMGLSPYYRGSSCNFWALYDNRESYVGATVHLLSKGLDSGDILYHCIPQARSGDTSFDYSMRAVEVAHRSVVERILNGEIFTMPAVKQDRALEVRYTRNADFTDEVAAEFLARKAPPQASRGDLPTLLHPYV
jgi:folate-dependent phosphoribosylglycinamide formyltransferase PurN